MTNMVNFSLYCIYSAGRGGVFLVISRQTWTGLDGNICEGWRCALTRKIRGNHPRGST